uniref:Uncharacterized protein n=1 Tax=Anguilla anguilla TaxID=7936 RepID=A0A0E9WNM7_ANGAN
MAVLHVGMLNCCSSLSIMHYILWMYMYEKVFVKHCTVLAATCRPYNIL